MYHFLFLFLLLKALKMSLTVVPCFRIWARTPLHGNVSWLVKKQVAFLRVLWHCHSQKAVEVTFYHRLFSSLIVHGTPYLCICHQCLCDLTDSLQTYDILVGYQTQFQECCPIIQLSQICQTGLYKPLKGLLSNPDVRPYYPGLDAQGFSPTFVRTCIVTTTQGCLLPVTAKHSISCPTAITCTEWYA